MSSIELGMGGDRRAGEALLPGFFLFTTILTGWVLAPGRRTVTGTICAADPEGKRAHDAYHRFFRAARWSTNALWKVLVLHMVAVLCPPARW